MVDDYVDSLVRLHSNVEDWAADAVSEISACGITALPVDFAENFERHNSIIVLKLKEFLNYCTLNNKPTVFVRSVTCDIQESIHLYLSRTVTDESNLPGLIIEFCSAHADSLATTTKMCPRFRRLEIFLIDNGSIVLTGVISETYEEFLDKLDEFCELTNNKLEEEELREEQVNRENLASLEDVIFNDEKFKSIRGKRKRCMYVEQAYGDRIPECSRIRRPDMNSDFMNALLVELVERVTDRIDLPKAAS